MVDFYSGQVYAYRRQSANSFEWLDVPTDNETPGSPK
jgi:hypothetical protein